MVFDYWPGETGESGRLTRADLAGYEQVIVFVSHGHPDHFTPEIYDWMEPQRVHYVLGDDVPEPYIGKRMQPGAETRIGRRVHHRLRFDRPGRIVPRSLPRGDPIPRGRPQPLALARRFHDEGNRGRGARLQQAVKPLEGLDIDVAFFPVDPRQGSLYDAGAGYFAMAVKPRLMIPMHWQGRVDVAQEFVRLNRSRRTEMVALTRPFESTIYYRQENEAPSANIPSEPEQAAPQPDAPEVLPKPPQDGETPEETGES